MSTLPTYVWVIVLAGLVGTTATICVMLWRGALTAGLSRRSATRMAAATAIVCGAYAISSALLAHADVYRFQPTTTRPWIGIAILVPLTVALLCTRLPSVAHVLNQPDALWRLTMPQIFRPVGVSFLVAMTLGQLPAVFALPAGLGDIAVGVEAVFVARSLRHGVISRRATWFNILGLIDLVVAGAIGFAAAPGTARALDVAPSTEAISLLPLALILTGIVPLAAALHLVSLSKLAKAGNSTRVAAFVGA